MQVARLCRRLRHRQIDLFVHVDGKSDLALFLQAIVPMQPEVHFICRRIEVGWGDFSMVRATLAGLEEILSAGEYDYVRLLSGQDYPIVPPERFLSLLEAQPGVEHIAWTALDGRDDYVRGLSRRYRYRHYHFRSRFLTLVVNKGVHLLSRGTREHPEGLVYKGSQWWTLSGDCVRYVLEYTRSHPEVMRFYRTVHCPDELFFQTIILHSPFADSVESASGVYADWSAGGASPKLLTTADFDRIAASGAWFARKFDMERDCRVLDLIDRQLLAVEECDGQ